MTKEMTLMVLVSNLGLAISVIFASRAFIIDKKSILAKFSFYFGVLWAIVALFLIYAVFFNFIES
jgi:hypothetical protein